MCIRHKLFLASFCLCFVAANSPPETFTVDLRAERTLKPFFDAGLHPRQRLGFETSSCVLPRQTTVALNLGQVQLPPIKADWEIEMRNDDRILQITGNLNRLLSLEEAKILAMSLNEGMGIPPADAAREIEAHAVPRRTGLPPPGTFRETERDGTELTVSYHLTASMIPERPFRMSLVIYWLKKREKFIFRDKPVTAPPGYEHLSMEPDRHSLFKPTGDLVAQQIQQISAERKVRIARETQALKALYDEEGRRQAAYRSMLTWWLAFVALLATGWMIWRWKKSFVKTKQERNLPA
ncbi:MAG: hypothetical protein IPK22_09475 [Verrucomicrobiaceae bacterium]|nr:hypothetical protein [Verrucomicrobiaceae bacterium]